MAHLPLLISPHKVVSTNSLLCKGTFCICNEYICNLICNCEGIIWDPLKVLSLTTFDPVVLKVINDPCLYLVFYCWMQNCNILILSLLLFLLTDSLWLRRVLFPLPPLLVLLWVLIDMVPWIYMFFPEWDIILYCHYSFQCLVVLNLVKVVPFKLVFFP